jgi:hypothetical protein
MYLKNIAGLGIALLMVIGLAACGGSSTSGKAGMTPCTAVGTGVDAYTAAGVMHVEGTGGATANGGCDPFATVRFESSANWSQYSMASGFNAAVGNYAESILLITYGSPTASFSRATPGTDFDLFYNACTATTGAVSISSYGVTSQPVSGLFTISAFAGGCPAMTGTFTMTREADLVTGINTAATPTLLTVGPVAGPFTAPTLALPGSIVQGYNNFTFAGTTGQTATVTVGWSSVMGIEIYNGIPTPSTLLIGCAGSPGNLLQTTTCTTSAPLAATQTYYIQVVDEVGQGGPFNVKVTQP